ncbi:MAG: phosphatidate cytidylyltransferase, partial [Lachnospiraceae bacterium]|nr:phosphatidate cytidylyltransferase [Lachnospiraceae bacterium]
MHRKILVGYAISITWATDIFAYLIGRYFGKHKLNPISPKKTIEGAIAGVIGAVVFTLFYTYLIKSFCKIE